MMINTNTIMITLYGFLRLNELANSNIGQREYGYHPSSLYQYK